MRPGRGKHSHHYAFRSRVKRRCSRSPAQQPLQPAAAISFVHGMQVLEEAGGRTERKIAQGGPVFREVHPSDAVGGVRGGIRFALARLSPPSAFARSFHAHSPLGDATFENQLRLRNPRASMGFNVTRSGSVNNAAPCEYLRISPHNFNFGLQ